MKKRAKLIGLGFLVIGAIAFFNAKPFVAKLGGTTLDTQLEQVKANIVDSRIYTVRKGVGCDPNPPFQCASFVDVPMVEYAYKGNKINLLANEIARDENSITVREGNKTKQTFYNNAQWRKFGNDWYEIKYDRTTKAQYELSVPPVVGFIRHALAGSQTFTSTGTFDPVAGVTSYTALCVAGGGGGGDTEAGGGGAGGVKDNQSITISSSQTVTIGGGGQGAQNNGEPGHTGGGSSIGAILTCAGGGGGGSTNSRTPGGGGSGGGGSTNTAGGSGTGGQGNNGGAGKGGGTAPGGGGGGCSQVGADASGDNGSGGKGGDGCVSTIDSNTYGGGGGGEGGAGNGAGGAGGGGGGNHGGAGTNGTANTGGGGGASSGTAGADGGSGIVIITWVAAAPSADSGEGVYLWPF